jgi:hypothetical protein
MTNQAKLKKSKSFKRPDEVRKFQKHGQLEVLEFGEDITIGKGTFEPGWKWSRDVKPIAETDSCMAAHSGYCIKGRMVIQMSSGEQFTVQEGDAFHIPPGHDAWVEGTEPCVLIDVGGYAQYAKKKAA